MQSDISAERLDSFKASGCYLRFAQADSGLWSTFHRDCGATLYFGAAECVHLTPSNDQNHMYTQLGAGPAFVCARAPAEADGCYLRHNAPTGGILTAGGCAVPAHFSAHTRAGLALALHSRGRLIVCRNCLRSSTRT